MSIRGFKLCNPPPSVIPKTELTGGLNTVASNLRRFDCLAVFQLEKLDTIQQLEMTRISGNCKFI